MKQVTYHYPDECQPFMDAILSIVEMHTSKGKDYGNTGNPYHNIEASEDLGIPAWVGVTLRMNDKEVRIKNFLKRGSLEHESVRDSIHDNAVYAILRLMEYDRIQTNELAVCEVHRFADNGICLRCGWSEPVSPEPMQYFPEVHAWSSGVCTRCMLIQAAYDHWKVNKPESILRGQFCDVKPGMGEPAPALRYNSKEDPADD